MDAAEYKHVVLGLIFLKYISDSFEEHHARLVAGEGEYAGANPEDKDEYLAANVFWVPKEARWSFLQANAKLPTIGKLVDDAMVALERDNPRLKGSLNKNYGRADLDKNRLGELIDLIGSIQLADAASRSKDLLGRVFEYFLTQFASAEGRTAANSTPPPASSASSWRWSLRTRAASRTPPAAPAACSSRVPASSPSIGRTPPRSLPSSARRKNAPPPTSAA